MKITLYTSPQGVINLKEGRHAVGEPQRTEGCPIEMSVSPEEIEFNGAYMLVKQIHNVSFVKETIR